MTIVGISPIAYQKLATLRADFLGMSPEERLAFTIALRSKRIKPPVKEPKLPKPPKLTKKELHELHAEPDPACTLCFPKPRKKKAVADAPA